MENTASTHSQEKPSGCRSRRITWPVFIIAGQIALLLWAFAILLATRAGGYLPVDPKTVESYQEDPRAMTYASNLLGTAFSTFSSYLFTQAVRHAIVVSLTRPVPISRLGFGILISKRTFIRRRGCKWLAISAIFFFATFAQTPSCFNKKWKLDIALDAKIYHHPSSIDGNWNRPVKPFVPGSIPLASALLSIMGESGTANARATAQAEYLTIVDFGRWTHKRSTRGIFPVKLQDFTNTTVNRTTSLTTVNAVAPFPQSTSSISYTVHQQGLKAALEGFGQTSYTVIIDGQGIYQGTYTCTIAPQIQYMISNYTDSIIYSDFDNFSTPIDAGPITLAAVETVQAAFT
ncbi:hypothetical protein B0H13DRAFT_1862869 [Mycena leptocephala]|nr:hypothetical protein B0H13DRAFT_1862869 [Mycena leptocephala]